MPYITPRGAPESPIWIILEKPLPSDKVQICDGSMGFAFQKMLQEAGLSMRDLYICSRRPDTDSPNSFSSSVDSFLTASKPSLVLLVGEAASTWLPELKPQAGQDTWRTQLDKYVGSLLKSPNFGWEHYAMPLIAIEDLMVDWRERNITTYIDLQKLRDEFIYWQKHGSLNPLPQRQFIYHDMTTDEVLFQLDALRSSPILSEDIETVYPRKGSSYYGQHPGIPVTFGIASSPSKAISFSIFRESPAATVEVWRAFDLLHSGDALIVGQNFFNFDSFFYHMLGFELRRELFQDTIIRHHILWMELPHKLQFLTRQYTRQPYYKDEGKQWSLKKMDQLRHYNCLDAAVTYEVYLAQEQEFAQRPHLR